MYLECLCVQNTAVFHSTVSEQMPLFFHFRCWGHTNNRLIVLMKCRLFSWGLKNPRPPASTLDLKLLSLEEPCFHFQVVLDLWSIIMGARGKGKAIRLVAVDWPLETYKDLLGVEEAVAQLSFVDGHSNPLGWRARSGNTGQHAADVVSCMTAQQLARISK